MIAEDYLAEFIFLIVAFSTFSPPVSGLISVKLHHAQL